MNNRTNRGAGKPKKMSGGKKALLAAGLVLCVLLLLFSAVYGVFSYYYGKLNIANPDDDTAVYLQLTTDWMEDTVVRFDRCG